MLSFFIVDVNEVDPGVEQLVKATELKYGTST